MKKNPTNINKKLTVIIIVLTLFLNLNGQNRFLSKNINSNLSLYSSYSTNNIFINSKEKKIIKNINQDSIKYIPWESQKHLGIALGELGIVQFIPWAFARWVQKWDDPSENWAKIGFNSWWENLKLGWEYDEDKFSTNYFAHPYHGNLYFNVGRANGFDFGESAVWTLSGSALWELFGETERPAFNDWVNTSVNGITLGEITYKLATLVTDNTATGSKRVFTEIAGALINPVRGFNRLISGESKKIFPNPDWRIPKNFYLMFNGGFRQLERGDNDIFTEGIQEGIFDFEIHYNNGYGKDLDIPFSSINLSLSIASSSPNLTQLTADGNLYGWYLKKDDKLSHILNISLFYNYVNNKRFIYGGTSVIPHLMSNFKIRNNLNINTIVGMNIVLMGATPNDYLTIEEGRDYDFGPGLGNYLSIVLKNGIWDLLKLNYQGQWIWTQSEPGDSQHHLHSLMFDAQLPLTNYFAVGLGAGVFWRESHYNDFDDVNVNIPILKVFFKTVIF